MTQLAQTMNIMVTVINWFVFVPYWFYETEKLKEWSSKENLYNLWISTMEHSIPLIISSINLIVLTDATVYMTDFWVIILAYIAYIITAFVWTSQTGRIIYTQLDFNPLNWQFWVTLVFSPIAGVLIHILVALFTQVIHQRYEWDMIWWHGYMN